MHYTWYHKLGFGVLVALWVAFGSHMIGEFLVHAEPLVKPAFMVAGVDGGDKPAATPEAAKAPAAADDVMSMLASADAGKGASVFKKCKACHTPDQGGANRVGPNLWDIVGRAKGSAAGYKYSDAMMSKGGAWTLADLDGFLAKPKAFLPGTKMGFFGIKETADRAALIAYLNSLSATPKPLQ